MTMATMIVNFQTLDPREHYRIGFLANIGVCCSAEFYR